MSTKSKKRSRAPASAGTFLQNWLKKSQCNDGANGGAENLNDDGHLIAATGTAGTAAAATMPATGAANGDEDASQSDGSAPKPRPAKLSRSAITLYEIDDLAFSEDEDSSDDESVGPARHRKGDADWGDEMCYGDLEDHVQNDAVLRLGAARPTLQRQSKMCPLVRELARQHADRMVEIIRPKLLNPRSLVIPHIKERKTRDDTVLCSIYAVYRRSDGALLKIGLASSLKTRKELGYNDDDGVVVRMVFRIDGMPQEMDSAVAQIYDEFWDAVRDDPDIDPYYHDLEKLVRADRAGGLGIDKKIVAGLLEYGIQRMCGVSAPLECMTCDAQIIAQREAMVIGTTDPVNFLIDDVLQPSECDSGAETFAVGSWETARYGLFRSSQIDFTEYIVGQKKWEDTVKHVINPDYTTMEEVYDEEAHDWPPHIIALAQKIMAKWLRYAGSMTRKRPLFIIVDRNKCTGYPDSRVLEQEIMDNGFTRVAEVFGKEVVVFVNREARSVLCLHSALSIAADARNIVTVEQAVLRCQAAEFMAMLARRATGQATDFRALKAAALVEYVRNFVHMGPRHSAVIVRHTVTPDDVDAIKQSNLPIASSSNISHRARYIKSTQPRDIKSTRAVDNDIIERALARLSQAKDDAEFNLAVETTHADFSVGVDAAARSRRWNLLTQDWLASGSDTLERVHRKKKELMANAGNVNARNATDAEVGENNQTISALYSLADGTRFWILDRNEKFPAQMSTMIPSHNGESYPVYKLKYSMVTSRVAMASKGRVLDIKCPAEQPPSGWNIEIVGKTKALSRARDGGSVFVLCAIKLQEEGSE